MECYIHNIFTGTEHVVIDNVIAEGIGMAVVSVGRDLAKLYQLEDTSDDISILSRFILFQL